MKLFVKAQIALMQLRDKKGQNTVEYLFMLMIIVGVVLLVGGLIKAFMPELFDNIKAKMLGGISGHSYDN